MIMAVATLLSRCGMRKPTPFARRPQLLDAESRSRRIQCSRCRESRSSGKLNVTLEHLGARVRPAQQDGKTWHVESKRRSRAPEHLAVVTTLRVARNGNTLEWVSLKSLSPPAHGGHHAHVAALDCAGGKAGSDRRHVVNGWAAVL